MADRNYLFALEDYQRARRQAALEQLLGRITGTENQTQLLSYEEVRQQLQAIEKNSQRLEEIPLDAIIGSVDRYHDFTRRYLPRKSISRSRWAKVMSYARGLTGMPPIDVYQIGEVYFVKDGNHRVSVARRLGNQTIQAYVTELETKVKITPDLDPNQLIIKAEQVRFLEQTNLDQLRPEADLTATTAGAYPTILEHIRVHRYFMGLDYQREISFQEAVTHWYDQVYQPVIQIIRSRGLLKDFPDRTEADLYLWIARHRQELEQEIGWDIGSEAAVTDLAEQHSLQPLKYWRRFFHKIRDFFLPDIFEVGPPPGTWRKRRQQNQQEKQLFGDILTAMDDSPNAWHALDLSVQIAGLEGARVHGLHIHSQLTQDSQADHQAVQKDFEEQCRQGDVPGFDFHLAEGEPSKTICKHGQFADLVVLPLNHPPGEKTLERIGSGLRTLIRSCPPPLLTVPGPSPTLSKAVLAYDSSPKSKEALFIGAYLAGQWQTALTVLTSSVGLSDPAHSLREAQSYLKSVHVDGEFRQTDLPIVEAIQQDNYDLVLIGGYGSRPMLEVVLGSVVDRLLREVKLPTLICR